MTFDVEKYLRATGRSPTRKRKASPETGAASPAPETPVSGTPLFRIVDTKSFRPTGIAAEMETEVREPWMNLPKTGVLSLGQASFGAAGWRDRYYHVNALDRLLKEAGTGRHDLYVTQATFRKRAKTGNDLGLGLLAHCDIDIHTIASMAGDWTMSQVVARVLSEIDDLGLARPSYLVFSGRGFAAKWLFSSPVPRRALSRLRAVNVEICRRLKTLGADSRATDCSRVLRVVGSVNTKSGEQVRVVWANERDGALVRYAFDLFSAEVLPKSPDEIRAERSAIRDAARQTGRHPEALRLERERAAARRPRQRGAFPAEQWGRLVLSDLEALVNARWGGTTPEGYRDTVAHLAGCALAQTVPADALRGEWDAWVTRFLPAGYGDSAEFRRSSRTVLQRAQRAAGGETVEHDGEQRTTRYTYTKDAMIELLRVTPDEQRGLVALIGAEEKGPRRREARRERGRSDRQRVTGLDAAGHRAERARNAQNRAQQARTMRDSGASWKSIAEALQTTPDGARKLASRNTPAA